MSTSSPSSQDDTYLDREFVGVPPPENARLPTAREILDLTRDDNPRGHLALPPEAPVFWIKYGNAVYWNEVIAQAMAHHELRRLGSTARAPAVFYAFQRGFRIYIVMEYIPGKTFRQRLSEAQEPEEKEDLVAKIAACLSDLHRIPVPPGLRPAAVDGGWIRHKAFDVQEAPRHYENVKQMEDHLNEFLRVTKAKRQFVNLSLEPMVFCHSDLYPDNFLIDDAGRVTVIDFADASLVPSSFASFAVLSNRLGFKLTDRVWIPTAEGVDNTYAVDSVDGRMAIGWAFLARLGRRMPGGDEETQKRLEESIWPPNQMYGQVRIGVTVRPDA